MNENLAVFSKDVLKMLNDDYCHRWGNNIQKQKKKCYQKLMMVVSITSYFAKNLQQSRKFAAISNSNAISGAMGNSGISVLLLVYRTLYMKYVHTLANTWELLLITES